MSILEEQPEQDQPDKLDVAEIDQRQQPPQDKIIVIENLDVIDEKSEPKSAESERSEYVEELVQEQYEKELDLSEITDQILKKFNEIKEVTFTPSEDKNK